LVGVGQGAGKQLLGPVASDRLQVSRENVIFRNSNSKSKRYLRRLLSRRLDIIFDLKPE